MAIDTLTLVSVQVEFAAKLNFASHQNSFPILRALRIENSSPTDRLEGLTISLDSNPAFLKPKIWHVERIDAHGSITISDRDIELDGNFLLRLADSMRGSVQITVKKDETVLAEVAKDVELLAFNEWGGAGYMPELLAAFSVPNDPSIDRILKGASTILQKAGKKDSIDGYQSGSRERVWEIVSAIYSAISNIQISYAEPPASFEQNGQKIRLPKQLLDARIGTCLDTAMLFASAFEQAGLNPIIALPEGHALAGVWLQPETLSTIVIDEAETLRKRVQLRELVLFETTFATSHPAPSFSKAVNAVDAVITQERDDSFGAAVDIKRARMHRILPLGLKFDTSNEVQNDIPQVELVLEEAPSLPDFDTEEDEGTEKETPDGRIERWQRRLLDLTLRNPLLNHKATTTSLRILCPNPGILEDKLAEGVRISIQPVPQATTFAQDDVLHQKRTGELIAEEYAREALENKQVLVDLPEKELSQRVVEIYRKAQTALQEGGANTLYLALGFLLWKRDDKDGRRFRAPLILVPVSLERKSVRSGVKMVAHDDESRFNTTLLEMLRKDFGIDIQGLDGELPTDHSGIDVDGIWNRVRQRIKEAPGFEVVEDVVLGHFSFAKYLMWKDLVDRTDALRENSVVRHLIDTPRDPYPSEIGFVDEHQIDQEFAPSDLLTPLPADASQMSAIATADRGKDFVIMGPPGTGKSQTISNMIAHLLGKGKTVLFVSEKTAALEVVHRRLEDIGLGKFCLQLHSNKARKAEVLNQLRVCWDSANSSSTSEWKLQADKLKVLRDQLNKVVDHLHRKGRNGLTPHFAMGVKVRDEGLSAHVSLSWPSATHHDETDLRNMRDAVDKLAIQAEAIGDFSKSPFSVVSAGEWSPQWETKLVELSGRLSTAAQELQHACQELCGAIGIGLTDHSMSRLEALSELTKTLLDSFRKQTSFALEADGAEQIDALEQAVSCLKAYAEAQASLSCSYDPFSWRKIDGEDIARRWSAAEQSWFLKRQYLRWRVIRDMRGLGAQGKPTPEKDAVILTTLRALGEEIDRLDKQLSGFREWKAHSTDPSAAEELQVLGRRVRGSLSKLTDDSKTLVEMRAKVRTLLNEGNDLLGPEAVVGRTAERFQSSLVLFQQVCLEFEAIAGKSIREHFQNENRVLELVTQTAERIVSSHQELRDWCAWRKRRAEAVDLDLLPLIEAIEAGHIQASDVRETFEASYCSWWSGAIIGEDEVLRTFSTPEHSATIMQFREIDSLFLKLTAEFIAARLSGGIPEQEDIRRSSQWGILQREIRKKARHKPIRQLTQEIPEVFSTLAPCVMMSPLSVAQYLPADQSLFDVVIFDEASQITVWDAVGSIARGRQVIVAGDPKQMPPTNFFARSNDDSDPAIDDEGDLESILDEMLGASIPERPLNLHYRSRRESLIAFSNAKYYDNALITFPAPVVPDTGVSLVRPTGFYARGGARHNQGEARAIAKEVVRRLTNRDQDVRNRSIGVVTFNSEQQSLIMDLLDEERSRNPEIEWAFSNDHTLEPVFVKNLETVQGDERDVILFSITYGPDQSDHLTMNFGPLNRVGGERRLNVAMTRARSEMIIYSTLHPERIDLSRSQARAVADLKHFLEYAERGPDVLGAFIGGSKGDFESPFEVAVARALKERGWQVHSQVGVSAYRIDLGVVHPDYPGVYLAGVECDGAMYHSSAYARERDKIRQSVLENLGWTLFRVWSTDWWTNRAKALDSLDNYLSERLRQDREERSRKASELVSIEDKRSFLRAEPDSCGSPESVEKKQARVKLQVELPFSNDQHQYISASFDEDCFSPDPDSFYSDEYGDRLVRMIEHLLDVEGPIHEEILIKRIVRHHGFQRAGNQIRNTVLTLARNTGRVTSEPTGRFFWSHKSNGVPSRYANRDDELRNVDYICSEELRAISEALRLDKDPTNLARTLGIARLSKSARQRIEAALSE